jgi:hypothetical protein
MSAREPLAPAKQQLAIESDPALRSYRYEDAPERPELRSSEVIEHDGSVGRYIYDPVTKRRELVDA